MARTAACPADTPTKNGLKRKSFKGDNNEKLATSKYDKKSVVKGVKRSKNNEGKPHDPYKTPDNSDSESQSDKDEDSQGVFEMTGSDSVQSEDEKSEAHSITTSIFDDEKPMAKSHSPASDFKVAKSKKLLKPITAKGKSVPRKKSITKTSAIRPVKKTVNRSENVKSVKNKSVKDKSAKDKSAKDKSVKDKSVKDKSVKKKSQVKDNEDDNDMSDNDDNVDPDMDRLDVSPGFKKCGPSFVAFQLELNNQTQIMVQGVEINPEKIKLLLDTINQKVKQNKIMADKKNQKMEHAAEMAHLALGELLKDSCKMAPGVSQHLMTRLVDKACDSVEEVSSDEDSVESGCPSKVGVSAELTTVAEISDKELTTEAEISEKELTTEAEISGEELTSVGQTSTKTVALVDEETTEEQEPTV